MADKRIITEKELNYIETLYTYCNLQDFYEIHNPHIKLTKISYGIYDVTKIPLDILSLDAHGRYRLMLDYLNRTILTENKYLNEAKGRSWYRVNEKYRIGIMDYDKALKSNQFNVLIQYEQPYMFELNNNLDIIELPLGGELSDYHIKRIDVTKIAQHKENYLKDFGFISSFRGFALVRGTVYLGNRSCGNVLRMYDKTKELFSTYNGKKIDWNKINLLSTYFGSTDDLWTYELEMTRIHLKDKLGIETLADYKKVFPVYQNTVGKVRFYPINDKNMKLIKQNNRKRIEAYNLTDFVTYERVKKKEYKPSKDYAVDRIIKIMDRYIDAIGIEKLDDSGNVTKEFLETYEDMVADIIQRVIINPFKDDEKKFYEEREILRDNQSNELEVEAKKEFTRKYIKNAEY